MEQLVGEAGVAADLSRSRRRERRGQSAVRRGARPHADRRAPPGAGRVRSAHAGHDPRAAGRAPRPARPRRARDRQGRGRHRQVVQRRGGAAAGRSATTAPSWSPTSARSCASRSSSRTAGASRGEGRSASSTSSCATWPTRASSRPSAPISMSATRTGWSARRASGPASTRRSSDTTSSVPTATSPSWRRSTRRHASWPLALPASGRVRYPRARARRHPPGGQPARASRVAASRRRPRPPRPHAQAGDRPGRDRRPVPCRRAARRPDPGRAAREGLRRLPRRRGSQQVVTLEDERSPITIGRRLDNDIALSWDSEVSRRHAHLLHAGEGWALVDDESRNGSYLNGERVSRQRPLRDGDVFRFGDTVVLFRAPVPDEHRARRVFLEPEQVTYMGQTSTHAPKPDAE